MLLLESNILALLLISASIDMTCNCFSYLFRFAHYVIIQSDRVRSWFSAVDSRSSMVACDLKSAELDTELLNKVFKKIVIFVH